MFDDDPADPMPESPSVDIEETKTTTTTTATIAAPKPPKIQSKPINTNKLAVSDVQEDPKFELPTDKTFVRYGDLVSLYDQLGSCGFLNADGVIDDSLRVLKRRNGELPDKFRDCVFQIMPSQQYAAQKEFRKKVLLLQLAVQEEEENEAIGDASSMKAEPDDDEGYYESLQDSATKEVEMNDEHNAEKIDNNTVLKYGQTVQLLHHKTKKYLTANVKRVASAEKDCQYMGVEDGGSAYSWFTILPRYKMRSLGDEVETGDCVMFELNKQENTYLHSSPLPGAHLVPFQAGDSVMHEASIGALTGWTLTLYRSAATCNKKTDGRSAQRGTLQAGTLVRMYHTEARSFVGIRTKILRVHAKRVAKSGSACTKASLVHIEKPEDIDVATWRPPASSVWILETFDRLSGATTSFNELYRLRHFATGAYLYRRSEKVLQDQNRGKALKGLPPVQINIGEKLMKETTGCVSLESTSCDDTKAIPLDTGCYLKAAVFGSGETEQDKVSLFMGQAKQGALGVRNNLEWDPEGSSEDTIKFLGVRAAEVQELEILSSLVPFVQHSKDNLHPENFRPALVKLLLMKLRLLLAFVYRQNFGHVPTVDVKVYDPQNEAGVPPVQSRQQAARELGAVQACIELISHCGNYFVNVSPNGSIVYKPPSDEFQVWMQRLVRILFLIVESFIDNHEENQNFVALWLPKTLLKFIDCDVNAERMITTMLTSNRELLEGDIGQTTMARFLELVQKKGVDESALRFLAEVSAADGEAVEQNQTKICEQLLKLRPELLLTTVLPSMPNMPDDGGNSKSSGASNAWKSNADDGMGSMPAKWKSTVDIKEFKADDGGTIMGESVRSQVLPIRVGWGEEASKKSCKQLFGYDTVSLERLSEELHHAEDMKNTGDLGPVSPGKKKDDGFHRVRIANCYAQQIHLLAELCKDRNYIAINLLHHKYPYVMCISVVANLRIHTRIRSEFARLCSALWVDSAPQQKLLVPNFTRSWEDSEKNIETLPAANHSNKFIMVQELIANHFNALGGCTKVWDEDTNRLTLEFLTMTKHLVEFGFYNTIGSLRNLCDPLVSTLDGRNDQAILPAALTKNINRGPSRTVSVDDSAAFTHALTRRRTSRTEKLKEKNGGKKSKKKLKKKTSIIPGGSHKEERSEEEEEEIRIKILNDKLRYSRNDQNELVALSKMQICDVLVAVSKFTTDVRMSHLVMNLKTALSKKDCRHVLDNIDTVITDVIDSTDYLDTDNLSENTDICDVLMDLCKYDCPQLTASVVDLMLAQVSQKRELMEGASKLQLLFSKAAVEAWSIIKVKVTEVLDLIERHEVWAVLETDEHIEQSTKTFEMLNWILSASVHGINTQGGSVDARSVKKMMLNARAVRSLTEIFGCDAELEGKDAANANTRRIAAKVNAVLQGLCRDTPTIQETLFEYLDKIMFWNDDLANPPSGFATLTDIFSNNLELCSLVPNEISGEIAKSVLKRKHENNGEDFSGKLLDPLMALVMCNNAPVRRNQKTVMQALWESENSGLLMLYNEVGEGTYEELLHLQSEHSDSDPNDVFIRPRGHLQYYISLLHLLAACCRGKATVEEVRCKSLFSFNELAKVIIDPKSLFVVKLPVIMVMYDAYLDSDLHGEGVEEMQLHMPVLLNELLSILKSGKIIKFLGCGLIPDSVATPQRNNNDNIERKSSGAANAWAVQKDVMAFAGSGGSRGTTMELAGFNLQGIIDFVLCGIAGVVGQELYTKACPERDEIINDCKTTLKKIAKCRKIIIGDHEMILTDSQISKCEFAWTVTQNGGDIGAWIDPTLNQTEKKSAGKHGKKRRQSAVKGMKTSETGQHVLWIVQRMAKHPKLKQLIDEELDPIVDRTLLALWGSTVCEHEKKWFVLPEIDLWGIQHAPKIKPPERADGSIIKLVKYMVSGALNNQDNVTLLRMVELFYAVLKNAKNSRGVRYDGKLDKNGFPRMVYYQIPDIKGAQEDYLELVVQQLTRLGVCEVCMSLLGQDWLEDHVYEKIIDFSIDLLKYSHINKEDGRVVQENMIEFLLKDLGEPATISLQSKLEQSQQWSKYRRQKLKLHRKTLKNEIKTAKRAEKAEKKSGVARSPSSAKMYSRGKEAEKELQLALEASHNGPAKATSDKFSDILDAHDPDDDDPGASGKLLRLLDLLCSGQYKKGQIFMSNQKDHKQPVNFLQDSAIYISAMAKDFEIHHDDLLQAYGSLKSFLTGPCKPNQLSMAMETECVLITNRILRELYKKAKSTYSGMTGKHGSRKHRLKPKAEREEEKEKVASWSQLGKEVIETLLSMIEGRMDAVVHHRILSVVQKRNLKDRLVIISEKIDGNFFNERTEKILTEEGVEIMNLLMTLSEHDKMLYREIMIGENEPFFFFREKMGRVEIVFHDNLLPVFFLIPPMCQVFSHVPLGKMWQKCLPRDESTLVKYQHESMQIFDMMKQERLLLRAGVSGLFGTGKLAFMAQVSFMMALLINSISIATLAYTGPGENATTYQYSPTLITDVGLTIPLLQDMLTFCQIFTSGYLLIANIVLKLPVVYRTAQRERVAERIKLNLGKVIDPWGLAIPIYAAFTDFMFVYQALYLAFAIMSIFQKTLGPIFNSFHLMSIAVRNPVARNIFMAVIYPIGQLKIAAVVAFFLLYIFAIFQFFFLHLDFENGECNTLRSCVMYTVNWGTRSGGGIGETMPDPPLWASERDSQLGGDWDVSWLWMGRAVFDFLFFLIIIIIIMNIVFGIIIDTFSDLRSQRDSKVTNMKTMCFICGIHRDQFDQEGQTDFQRHCEYEHNKWHYLFYLIHCQLLAEEQPDDINAYERFVLNSFLNDDISWMPLGKAITMGSAKDPDDQENESKVGSNVVSMKTTVEQMKNDMEELQENLGDQMNEMKEQIAKLLSNRGI